MRAELLSAVYQRERQKFIDKVYARQERDGRVHNLEEAIKSGDRRLHRLARFPVLGKTLFSFPIPDCIGADLYDLHFPSPVIAASFKGDLTTLAIWASLGLGGISTKTIMPRQQDGNPDPRIAECGEDLINAVGLPSYGPIASIDTLLHSPFACNDLPVIFSIGGDSPQEYLQVFSMLNEKLTKGVRFPYGFEVNISCPNTSEGMNLINHPDLLYILLTDMRKQTDRPIGVKSPREPLR